MVEVGTGWSPALSGSADRDNTVDRRLAGIVYSANFVGAAVKDFTITRAGTYTLRVAVGDFMVPQDAHSLDISDTATPKLTLNLPERHRGGAVGRCDGVLRTAAAWPGSNVGVTVTFATTTLRIALGQQASRSGYSTLSHVSLEPTGAPVAASRGLLLGVG